MKTVVLYIHKIDFDMRFWFRSNIYKLQHKIFYPMKGIAPLVDDSKWTTKVFFENDSSL